MLLRHEIGLEDIVGVGGIVSYHVPQRTLSSLVDLNSQCLELLTEQSLEKSSEGVVLREVGRLWRVLDAEARARAAACPFLLFDAGFADPKLWCGIHADPPPTDTRAFFGVNRVQSVARQVVLFVWHLAQSNGFDAQLLLGIPVQRSNVIGAYTLSQIHQIAEGSSAWVSPRWPNRMIFWRHLLLAAASGQLKALEAARLQGLQLMAADVLGWRSRFTQS